MSVKSAGLSFDAKQKQLADGDSLLRSLTLTPDQAAKHGLAINRDGRKRSAFELLSYPDIDLARLIAIWPEIGRIDAKIAGQLAVDARYAVYVKRQELDIAAFRKEESIAIPRRLRLRAAAWPVHRASPEARAAAAGKSWPGGAARWHDPGGALLLLLAHLKKGAAAKSA